GRARVRRGRAGGRGRSGSVVALVALVAVVALGVGAGCGVRSTRGASTASDKDVPYDLLSPTVATTTTVAPQRQTRPTELFFVRNGALVPAVREVANPVRIDEVLAALAAGPSESETSSGLRTALPAGNVIASASVAAGTARVALTDDFA